MRHISCRHSTIRLPMRHPIVITVLTGVLLNSPAALTPRAEAEQDNAAPPLSTTTDVPLPRFHLTATTWQPDSTTVAEMLDVVEGICRFSAQHQDDDGAIIDPFLQREHQYATPYFAFAVGALMHFERAEELWPAGIRAMEHASRCLGGGFNSIPDRHGEFFVAPLAEAMTHYRPHVSDETWDRWTNRLQTPITDIMQDQHGRFNNWRTYAMKGEWLRARHGWSTADAARNLIEDAWLNRTQRARIIPDRWNFYQDWSSDPQSHAVEAVGRGNLLALIHADYDGPFRDEITKAVERGTIASLLWQDASGQAPPNGRTDNHVFNDVLYQLAFEVMAERMWHSDQHQLAGCFRQAAGLSFRSIARWARHDSPWEGSFFVTKNHFDPQDRVGYQPASQYTNYNGAVMYHLAECALTRQSPVPPAAAPVEIGGYVVEADPRFGSVTAAAGGIQMMINLRGDTVPKYDRYWTPLGAVRFSRLGWDSRLGPSDGTYDGQPGRGVTCGPTWQRGGQWVRLAEMAEHYRGTLQVDFVHPLLVRFSVLYHTVTGSGGPAFTQRFVITPDGILTTLQCHSPQPFGLTLPVMTSDGRPFRRDYDTHAITVRSPRKLQAEAADDTDAPHSEAAQQFIALSESPEWSLDESIRGSCGWLEPVRLTVNDGEIQVLIRPARAGDLAADKVRRSWSGDDGEFRSALSRVTSTLYVGRTSAGGLADRLDVDEDGSAELQFTTPCRFMAQLEQGRITAVETDTTVEASIRISSPAGDSNGENSQNREKERVMRVTLEPYTPWYLNRSVDAEHP